MSNFITNTGSDDLKKRLFELIKKSGELKFLVGFFYFSGIKELYNGLKHNPDTTLKVLVGLNVDKLNHSLVEVSETENISDEEKINIFLESLKKSLNTKNFDTKEFYEQSCFFINMIKENRLIIRKTYEPNHSKLYIFKLDDTQVARRNLFITGSSNLTKSGLSLQNEFNVEIADYGFESAEEYFDQLWDNAVKITEADSTKEKLINVVEKETLIKQVTPFEAFCLVLKSYLESFEQKDIGESLTETFKKNGYKPYEYQLSAVREALAIIEKNNGVIVADVVGLGKTIISCAIAKQLKKRGVVICPPGLMGDRNRKSGWLKYIEEFGLTDWEVRSLGDLEKTLDFVKKRKDIEVVIVDEAHRFRNQDTRDYELLKNICRDKQVILLTATPFNNKPADILSLLKLFITPKKSSITLENNLLDKFRVFKTAFEKLAYISKNHNSNNANKKNKAVSFYKALFGKSIVDIKKVSERTKYLAKQIRDVIEPVTIRRNRLDLQNDPRYKLEIQQLSKVADPIEWFFELTKAQSQFYNKIIQEYFGDLDEGGSFKGAIYRPFEYEKEITDKLGENDNRQYQQQRNLFDFMRRLIVKRFESSFGAFNQTLTNFLRVTKICRDFINKTGEYILDRALLEKIYELDEDDIEKHLLEYEEKIKKNVYPKNHKRYKLENFKYKEEFLNDIDSDINLFELILNELNTLKLVDEDPKTECLIQHLKQEFSKKPDRNEPLRKIIIFSEYNDTIKYLETSLKKHFGDKLLVVAGDLSADKVTKINENFDANYEIQKNDFELLLASDKISEGFNLNRAGLVVNYDIPWNPVRVIQRLGRINRISKKVFNELYIVNFFPTEIGAELVQSREIAANKMYLIHNALGEDAKIFDTDEQPTPANLFNKIQQNPENQEQESFKTKAYREFLKIKEQHPDIIKNIENLPPRIKVAKKFSENELIVFFKKNRLYAVSVKTDAPKLEAEQISFEDVFDKIYCDAKENSLDWNTDLFWNAYKSAQSLKSLDKSATLNEQSIEQKALNNLSLLINLTSENIQPYKSFLRMLKEDIMYYGSLSDYTLRRISNLKQNDDNEIKNLMDELGEDYLDVEKRNKKNIDKEIIVAIQNIKDDKLL